MTDDRKLRLALALEQEYNFSSMFSKLWTENNLSGYKDAIIYLRTGKKPLRYRDNVILLACIEDLATMLSDYDID